MKNRVKEFREKMGWSQEKLSEESEVSRNTISLLETNPNTNVTIAVMEKISKALKEKISIIFFDE